MSELKIMRRVVIKEYTTQMGLDIPSVPDPSKKVGPYLV